jgi:hypothetical protein
MSKSLRSVNIKWGASGSHVLLATNYTQFRAYPMSWENSTWFDEINLPVDKTVRFKFVVDGEWRVSKDYDIKKDQNGEVNEIKVDGKFPEAKFRDISKKAVAGKNEAEQQPVGRRREKKGGEGKEVVVNSSAECERALLEGDRVKFGSEIKELFLSYADLEEEEVLNVIKELQGSNLVVLNLSHNKVGDKGAKLLAEILNTTKLQELYLWSTNITDEGYKSLSNSLSSNTTLTSLQLRSNPVTADALSHLAKSLQSNSTLRVLDLWYNPVSEKSFTDFADVVAKHKALQEIHIHAPESLNQKAVDGWVKAIKGNKVLRDLHIFILDKRPFQTTVDKLSSLGNKK